MSSGTSACLFHPGAECITGQKLISMLMVLTNVLWSGCHFWADLNCPPELNCTVNYHIIAFSAVIYVHMGAGVLQLVGCGISLACLTPNTAGCFSTSKHQSPPPSSCSFLSLFLWSFSLFLAFIHSSFFQFTYRQCSFILSIFHHLSQLYLEEWQWSVLRVKQ